MVDFRLYPVSSIDRYGEARTFERLARAASLGLGAFQLREKNWPAERLLAAARRARDLLRPHRTRLLINDRIDVALAAGADGVHLPASSLPPEEARALWPSPKLLGCSVHTLEELRRAERGGADFVTLAPVFPTAGKGPSLGMEAFRRIVRVGRIPIFALGGLDLDRLEACRGAGAHGASCISLFWEADRPETVLNEVVRVWGSL